MELETKVNDKNREKTQSQCGEQELKLKCLIIVGLDINPNNWGTDS